MQGKTVVITGATWGIGLVAAEALARAGARIVFIARDAVRGQATLTRLLRANPDAAHDWVRADLSEIAAMKMAGEAVLGKVTTIDVLINNAGAIFDRREVTRDGLERTFAVNHMAYFVVTEVLRPALSPHARVVSTASTAHTLGRLDFDDLQSARGYSGFGAYGRSKLCNILWTRELARQFQGSGMAANCLHPGAVATGFGDNTGGWLKPVMSIAKRFMISPAEGADTIIHLASSPTVEGLSGGYWTRRRQVEPSSAARDAAAARRLWDESARLAGLPA